MTRTGVEKLLRVWQERLGLQNWRITLNLEEPTDEDAYATTWRSDSYDKAEIKLSAEWRTWTEEVAAEHLVHELLHLHTRDIEQVWDRLDGQLHRDLYEQTEKSFMHEVEGMIDRLAFRLVALAA